MNNPDETIIMMESGLEKQGVVYKLRNTKIGIV